MLVRVIELSEVDDIVAHIRHDAWGNGAGDAEVRTTWYELEVDYDPITVVTLQPVIIDLTAQPLTFEVETTETLDTEVADAHIQTTREADADIRTSFSDTLDIQRTADADIKTERPADASIEADKERDAEI